MKVSEMVMVMTARLNVMMKRLVKGSGWLWNI